MILFRYIFKLKLTKNTTGSKRDSVSKRNKTSQIITPRFLRTLVFDMLLTFSFNSHISSLVNNFSLFLRGENSATIGTVAIEKTPNFCITFLQSPYCIKYLIVGFITIVPVKKLHEFINFSGIITRNLR